MEVFNRSLDSRARVHNTVNKEGMISVTQSVRNTMQQMLHVRLDGQSAELPLAALDLSPEAADQQIKQAVARHFGRPATALGHYVVVRHTGAIVVRPEAIYG